MLLIEAWLPVEWNKKKIVIQASIKMNESRLFPFFREAYSQNRFIRAERWKLKTVSYASVSKVLWAIAQYEGLKRTPY